MLGLILLIPSFTVLSLADEMIAAMFAGVALIDCLFNNSWQRYKLLWIIIAIMLFYVFYSLFFVHYNSPLAVIWDFGIEIKPFLPFAVILAIRPTFTKADKQIISIVSLFNAFICLLCVLGGKNLTKLLFFHPTYLGITAFTSAMFLLALNLNSFYKPGAILKALVVFILTIGLASGRSKYFGIYILSLFFIFIYKPGFFSLKKPLHMGVLAVVTILIIIVSWNKFYFYFVMGAQGLVNPNMQYAFARPVLYLTAGMILIDHFPFGSGLASFASYPSSVSYSGVFYEYGINNVHGLSPRNPSFICDAFYPSLAQYGVVGLILFIVFWVYTYSFLKKILRFNNSQYLPLFVVGSLIICFLLIESIAANTFTQSAGLPVVCLLAMICGFGENLSQHQTEYIKTTVSPTTII